MDSKLDQEETSALTLSLWKGRKTNRPKANKAPVLSEMMTEVLASQVTFADDFTTAVWLANDELRVMARESTFVPRLSPEKLAWGEAAFTALLLFRESPEAATPVMVAAQEAIFAKGYTTSC